MQREHGLTLLSYQIDDIVDEAMRLYLSDLGKPFELGPQDVIERPFNSPAKKASFKRVLALISVLGVLTIPLGFILWIWIPGMWKLSLADLFVFILFAIVYVESKNDGELNKEKPKSGFQERLDAALAEQERIRKAKEN